MTARIYQNINLAENETITLDKAASHHLLNVLRIKKSEPIIIFNGQGGEFEAEVFETNKNFVQVQINKHIDINRESPVEIHLAQGISRGEKMDFTIQKAVELGVKKITPLITEFCNVKLPSERWQKKLQHWQSIIISACEQCGRTQIPEIFPPIEFSKWMDIKLDGNKIILEPTAERKISDLKLSETKICLLIGSEGGFSETEINLAEKNNFTPIKFGPRILRTETAGLAVIAAVQVLCGDL